MNQSARVNRWALTALVERGERSKAEVARDAMVSPGTLSDLLSGRRDASEETLTRIAEALNVDVRAVSADPYGIVDRLVAVADAATVLAPHINGHDFGLRDALRGLHG